MNETTTRPADAVATQPSRKPGFFARLFQKLDNAMQKKAAEKSGQSCCCKGGDKGGKCC